MITALVLVFAFAALMFLVAALSAHLDLRATASTFRKGIFRRRRDRALVAAAFLLSVVVILVLAGWLL